MEIGKEGIDDFEFETRIDKNVVFAFGFAGFGPEFERASDSGTDSNHAVASSFGGLDGRDGFGWNLEPFGMHVVFFDIVATDWQESTKTNVKGEILNLYAFGLEFGESCFGHVEAGGWGGSRTEFFGPDGLVALNVVGIGVAMEIWWKWNVAVGFDDIGEWTVATDGSGAIAEDFLDGNLIVGIVNREDITCVKFAAVHDSIKIGFVLFEDDEFARTTIGKSSKKTRAHDTSVIKNN